MRIVFFAPYAPGHLHNRSFHFVRELLQRGHRVTLVYPRLSRDKQSRVPELEAAGAQILSARIPRSRNLFNSLTALLMGRPMQARYAWSPALSRVLDAELATASPDVVHVEHLRATPYVIRLKEAKTARRPVRVWDSVDCISSLLEQTRQHSHSRVWRLAAGLEAARTRRYERRIMGQFDTVLLASEHDLQELAAIAGEAQPRADLGIVPSGVDVSTFRFENPPQRRREVVFAGALSYHPNADAAIRLVEVIMPRVWAETPEAQLVVVGPKPPARLRRLASHAPSRIRITGWVPEVQPHVAGAAAAAIPLRYGAGIQNKVLEAMACGTPVVADARSARAVGAGDDRELLVARTDQEYADAILRLLTDPACGRRLAEAGRRHVEENFNWAAAVDLLEQHYRTSEAIPNPAA